MGELYNAEQLVFVDESYADKRNTTRLTGWSKQGMRANTSAPFQRGRRYVGHPVHWALMNSQ